MFDAVEKAPPDAILGLSEAFHRDSNPDKINLTVGVYQNESGVTPILETVKAAERKMIESESSKGYLPIPGAGDFTSAVQRLLFGPDHDVVRRQRAFTAHTPGGTGALRVAGDFLKQSFPDSSIWLSDPTWPNHAGIFTAAGVPVKKYPYLDAAAHALDFDALMSAVRRIPAGDVVLLHGCCHNPTGVDPTVEQWQAIAEAVAQQGVVPLLDFAYQGFADGVQEDAVGLRTLCQTGSELLVCSSFSKNFGLYRERVGALTVVTEDAEAAARVGSQVKVRIRTNYSNPPSHGGSIVATVLGDPQLSEQWLREVAAMRDRINGMRSLFVQSMEEQGVDRDFSFISRQRGMFSFSGLTREQVERLRDEHSIYIVGSGRINVAGITTANVERICRAIADVM